MSNNPLTFNTAKPLPVQQNFSKTFFHYFKSINGLLIFFTFCLAQVTAQKPAEEYYHHASAMYIEGRIQQAVIEVEEGLRLHPDDGKLNSLHEQLKKLQDQQQQEDPQQGEEGEEGEEEENQDQEQGEQNEQDQEPQDGNEDQEEPKDTSGTAEESEEPPPGEMSEEEAKRLLDSYKDDEKEDQERMHQQKQRGKVKIDW